MRRTGARALNRRRTRALLAGVGLGCALVGSVTVPTPAGPPTSPRVASRVLAAAGADPRSTVGVGGRGAARGIGGPIRLLASTSVGASAVSGPGYWLVGTDGTVYAVGDAGFFGSAAGSALRAPIVATSPTPDAKGYWLAAADGGVFAFGDAGYYGSAASLRLARPIVGMAATPDGKGYWLVGSDGGVLSFGDAPFLGSLSGHHLSHPIVGVAASPDGRGYWLVASDGGVFTFGDAPFLGSAAAIHLNQPMVGMAATPDGGG